MNGARLQGETQRAARTTQRAARTRAKFLRLVEPISTQSTPPDPDSDHSRARDEAWQAVAMMLGGALLAFAAIERTKTQTQLSKEVLDALARDSEIEGAILAGEELYVVVREIRLELADRIADAIAPVAPHLFVTVRANPHGIPLKSVASGSVVYRRAKPAGRRGLG